MAPKKKKQLESRKLMEMAIDAMRKSIHEKRKDGKEPPKVGVVIVKFDGSIESASRGELREGDHAEYTLLERKNVRSDLKGSTLYTTLEPCAPGARTAPKQSCAERVVWSRIKEVWVGIEDPDPTVDRKGIQYLLDHGIKVEMFPRDLQEEIREANREFIDQATERAAEQKKSKKVILSPLEKKSVTTMGFLTTTLLDQYRTDLKIADPVGSPAFRSRLVDQGLLKKEDGAFVPTGFGALLFGEHPRDVMPQAGILGTIHYPGGKEETLDFEGPLVGVPEQVQKWLEDKLPNTIDRSQMRRGKSIDIPFEMIREAVVNALVHRDYSIAGAKCQLVVTPETIIIKSPGGPVAPITLEQLRSFNPPMLSRNPVLHRVFAKMKLAEERGLGLNSLKSLATEKGLPLPKYKWEDPYLVLELYRSLAGAEKGLTPDTLKTFGKAERAGWLWLSTKDTISAVEYAEQMNIPHRTALNHLQRFKERGLIEPTGSGRKIRYKILGG